MTLTTRDAEAAAICASIEATVSLPVIGICRDDGEGILVTPPVATMLTMWPKSVRGLSPSTLLPAHTPLVSAWSSSSRPSMTNWASPMTDVSTPDKSLQAQVSGADLIVPKLTVCISCRTTPRKRLIVRCCTPCRLRALNHRRGTHSYHPKHRQSPGTGCVGDSGG